MTKVLTYVEIDIDYCSRTYGTAPCTAAIGVTGTAKCFNTLNTCQLRTAFNNAPITLRFGLDVGFLPDDIECIPSLIGVSFQPSQISLGKDLGTRASLTVTFKDHPHSDTGQGFDKYRTERGYDAFKRGSFWGKFRARQPFVRGRAIRLIRGILGQTLAEMTTRYFLIEDFDGPTPQGQYTITAKDILKLADGDRAQAPRLSNGYLGSTLTIGAGSFTIQPAGIGDSEYPASGYIAIGGKEICSFTRSGNNFTIARAQKNTTAVEHAADDRIQLCLIYNAQTPADILYDLFINYAYVPASYINLTDWQGEVNAHLQRLYSTTIADPIAVKTLAAELIEQAALALWESDTDQTIKLQVLRQIITQQSFTQDNIIESSLNLKEQPGTRINEVWTYYGQRNPLVNVTEPSNYRSTLATVDLQSESDFGASAIKIIFARWIPDFGQTIAERVNTLQLARYSTPPRQFSFMSHRFGDIIPQLGAGYNLEAWVIQDATGLSASVPIQITRLNADESAYQIEAEEATMAEIAVEDLSNRTITIDSNYNNFNLRTIHDTLYPAPETGESPTTTITCIINSGVIIGAAGGYGVAFDIGDWPSGVVIILDIRGRIQGNGGSGGLPGDGGGGGTALTLARPVFVKYGAAAQIWGGGGGGGGTYKNAPYFALGGGGGAGTIGGSGANSYGEGITPSENGTATAGGAGAYSSTYHAAAGGGPGLDGENATLYPGFVAAGMGGAKGKAINGNAHITVLSGSADIRGTIT